MERELVTSNWETEKATNQSYLAMEQTVTPFLLQPFWDPLESRCNSSQLESPWQCQGNYKNPTCFGTNVVLPPYDWVSPGQMGLRAFLNQRLFQVLSQKGGEVIVAFNEWLHLYIEGKKTTIRWLPARSRDNCFYGNCGENSKYECEMNKEGILQVLCYW